MRRVVPLLWTVRSQAPTTVALGGLGCLALAAWSWRRLEPIRDVQPLSPEEIGVLPEVARGLQTASELRPRT